MGKLYTFSLILIFVFTVINRPDSSSKRTPASIVELRSCQVAMRAFLPKKKSNEIFDQLMSIDSIDEFAFETLKNDYKNLLEKGTKDFIFVTPLEKIAYMEAYIEFYTRYPISTSMIEVHKSLTSKNRLKLIKILEKTDFEGKWSKRKYRKFIFDYYAILRGSSTMKVDLSDFSNRIQKFILQRAEQQILMNNFAEGGYVSSRLVRRIKLSLSIAFNAMMLKNVGAFYTFYELKLFTPDDAMIDRIFKNGLLSVKDDLLKEYKLRSGIEVTYNEIRPYLILTGLASVGASLYTTYDTKEELIDAKREEMRELFNNTIGRLFNGDNKEDVKLLKIEMEKEYLKMTNGPLTDEDKAFIADIFNSQKI